MRVGGRILRFQRVGHHPRLWVRRAPNRHTGSRPITGLLGLTGTRAVLDELELRAVRRLHEPAAKAQIVAGSGQDHS